MTNAATRRLVRQRADQRCEYCRTRQDDEAFTTYQVEHVIAIQHGGGDEDGNLALACSHCNLHKGPNLSGIDPVTNAIETLFNPRRQSWADHFEFQGSFLVGRTPCGRSTVRVLAMNAPARINLREAILDSELE